MEPDALDEIINQVETEGKKVILEHEEDLKKMAKDDLRKMFDLLKKQKEASEELDAFLVSKKFGEMSDLDFLRQKESNLDKIVNQVAVKDRRRKFAQDMVEKVALPTFRTILSAIL